MLKVCDGYIKRYITALMILLSAVIVLANSERTAQAVRYGIDMCVGSVIPSLFPMIFLSQYLIKSGGAEEVGKILNKPTEKLFGLPGVCGVAVLTGMFGGFPAGARAAETLVNDRIITRRQGRRLAVISFSSGPGFTIGMVGAELYKNKSSGLMILTVQIISCIMIGIMLKLICGSEVEKNSLYVEHSPINQKPRGDAFVESAADTASTVIAMCSFIIVFQVISEMMSAVGLYSVVSALLGKAGVGKYGECLIPCLMEVTGGSILSVNIGLPFTAFVVGFGGLSVHFQNFAICREISLNKLKYIGIRLLQGLICGLLVSLIIKMPCFAKICAPTSTVLNSDYVIRFSRISYGFGALFLIMCLMSVVCLPQKIKVRKWVVFE